MTPKKTKHNRRARTFEEKLKAAMADYTPPTLEEMIDEGNRLFKPKRRVGQARSASAGPKRPARTKRRNSSARVSRPGQSARQIAKGAGARRPVGILPQEDPDAARSSSLTLPVLLDEIRKKRPRQDNDPEWSFVLGGTRHYFFINTSGPGVFSGGCPRWRAGRFEGCTMFKLGWPDVRKILEKYYKRRRIQDCFAGYQGTFEEY
jgi:hypothetical protein